MYKNIVLSAFKKAQKEVSGKINKTRLATHISEILLDEYRNQICERQLRNLFNESKNCGKHEDISISSFHIQYLCNYLGYDNYDHFLKENQINNYSSPNSFVDFFQNPKTTIILFSITIILVSITVSVNQQRWMDWEKSIVKKYFLLMKNLV